MIRSVKNMDACSLSIRVSELIYDDGSRVNDKPGFLDILQYRQLGDQRE